MTSTTRANPSPDMWKALAAPLTRRLRQLPGPAGVLFADARVTAVARRQVWLRFPGLDGVRGVGAVPGAASGLVAAAAELVPDAIPVIYTERAAG